MWIAGGDVMIQVDKIPLSGQFSVVFDTGVDVFSSTFMHEDGVLYFLNVNRELSEFEWVQIDFDQAMDSFKRYGERMKIFVK